MAKFKFDYLNAANVMVEKGDFEAALYYYFLERNQNPGEDVDLYIADTYSLMGVLNEALKFYMRVYAADQYNEDAVRGIILCLKDVDEDAAFYYLHCVLSGDAREDIGFEFEEYEEPPVLTVHDRRDKSEIMDKAFGLLESGNPDGAAQIFESINKDSYQYCDAVLARASIKMDRSEVVEASRLADDALKVNPKHVGTHILKVMACDAMGDRMGADEWVQKLDGLDAKSEDDVIKIALCLCSYGYYNEAEKYVKRKLEFTPYDKLMLLCLANIKMLTGQKEQAYKVAHKVNTVYPEDIEVKEMTSRILSDKDVKMPKELFAFKRDWAENIKNLFLQESDFTTPEHIMWIKWLLSCDDYLYLQSAVCACVTGMPEYDGIIDELLIDPFAPPMVKKQILLRRVCDDRTQRVKFVISNVFRSLKVEHPNVADNLKYAYYYVFVALAVMELSFENRLDKAIIKLADKYSACQNEQKAQLQINALAAHLYLMAQGGKAKNAFELFDCDEEEFKNAAEILGI